MCFLINIHKLPVRWVSATKSLSRRDGWTLGRLGNIFKISQIMKGKENRIHSQIYLYLQSLPSCLFIFSSSASRDIWTYPCKCCLCRFISCHPSPYRGCFRHSGGFQFFCHTLIHSTSLPSFWKPHISANNPSASSSSKPGFQCPQLRRLTFSDLLPKTGPVHYSQRIFFFFSLWYSLKLTNLSFHLNLHFICPFH